MIVIDPKAAALKPNPFNAIVKQLFVNNNSEILVLELEPQKQLAPVRVDTNAFFYILEGSPQIIIENEKQMISAEALIFCPINSMHCINNLSDSLVRILVIKQYG